MQMQKQKQMSKLKLKLKRKPRLKVQFQETPEKKEAKQRIKIKIPRDEDGSVEFCRVIKPDNESNKKSIGSNEFQGSEQRKSPISAHAQSDTITSKTDGPQDQLYIIPDESSKRSQYKVITKKSMDDTDLLVNLYNTIVKACDIFCSLHIIK